MYLFHSATVLCSSTSPTHCFCGIHQVVVKASAHLPCAAGCCSDGGILYICGVPGTGKTALVMEVLGSLEGEAHQAGAQLVAINCLQLPSPQHVFSRLWEKLSGQHLGPARWAAGPIQPQQNGWDG